MSASPIDPDIQAAFSGTSPSPATAPIDDDIKKAFASDGEPSKEESSILERWPMVRELKGATGAIAGTAKGVYDFAMHGSHEFAADPSGYIEKAAGNLGRKVSDLGSALGHASAVGQGLEEPDPKAAILDYARSAGETITNPEKRGAATANVGMALLGSRLGGEAIAPEVKPLVSDWTASPQSIGAASATFPAAAIQAISPELKTAVQTRINTGVPLSQGEWATIGRHLEADSLPVKMRLSEGQATQDPDIRASEYNKRGATGLSQFENQQNGQLVENLRTIRDNTGPDVFSTNPVEHGDTLISAYKAKDAAAQADIASKYQALRDANGGKFPVDAEQLLNTATANLHDKLLFDHAPKPVMSTLQRLAENKNMTFENFESLRTNLARIQRSATDGNERAAAGVIRDAMEQMPLSAGAEKLKPIADTARAAARAQFQAVEADPAYKAAVNDSVTPDRFVSRFVVGGARDDVAKMKANLADNPSATQTMGVSALDHLRQQAGIDSFGNGNFSQANFNKHLQALGPKLGSLVDPSIAQQLETLGNVARYTQFQPRGGTFNNSGTLSGAITEGARGLAETALNAKTAGIGGTLLRSKLNQRALRKEFERSTAPLAGISPDASGGAKP